MKKHLALSLASLLLAVSLTACGSGKSNNDALEGGHSSDNSASDSVISGDHKTEADSDSHPLEDAKEDMEDAADDVKDALTGDNAKNEGSAEKQNSLTGGVSFGQMLRNARVHDKDGDLTDHENSVTPGASHF